MISFDLLLIDVSASVAAWVVEQLQAVYGPLASFAQATSVAEVTAALQRGTWNLIVAGAGAGENADAPAFAALRHLEKERAHIPFVVIDETGRDVASAVATSVAAMRAGADDCIVAGSVPRFLTAVESALKCSTSPSRPNELDLETELRLRRLFDSGVTGVIVCDVAGEIVEANDTFLEMVGYTREDLTERRMNWREMTPPEYRPLNASMIDEARRSGRPIRFEKEYVAKDGARVPVSLGVATLDHRRYITAVTDLRHRKNAEARMVAVFESALDAIVGMDGAGKITDFNPAAERVFGYARAEVVGRKMSEVLIPPHLRELHDRGLARYLATGVAKVIGRCVELTAVRRDGVEFPIELSLSRVEGSGAPSFFGFIRDVSARKLAETALLDRAVVSLVSARIGLTLIQGASLRELLSACCQILVDDLGVAFARIWMLDEATDVLHLEASAGMYTHLDGAHARVPVGSLKIGRIAESRQPHITNDLDDDPSIGSHAWAAKENLRAFAGYPLLVDGKVIGVLAMFSRTAFSTITQTMLESVCDAIAVRAQGKLTERANSALEEQLRQSQKMEAVGRLAGGIAHDFNNVLSVVLSYSEMLLKRPKMDPAVVEDIREIDMAGRRAADLTRHLLMFSRQQVLEPRVLDLNDVLGGMDKMMRRIVGEDVRLTCEAGAGLGSVKIDPGSIEQVIVNLVVNARDAMPRGGYLRLSTRDETLAEDDVRSHPHRAPGEYVCLSVSDSGTGMTPDVLARIYEPFFTTKAVGKGTGLGLSTVFGIVQQGRGIVRVRSELDRGTTFEILLPRVDERAERRVEADSLATPRGTETVLLVEDEEQVRTVAAGILRRHGYQVLDARNAGDALLLCETHRGAIDLLVTDVVMPHMSGPDLARRLVAIRPQMRVLCMSGYTDDAAVRHGVFEAELEFLQKPFTVTSLTNRVRGVLDKMDSRAMRVAKRLLETAPS